MMAKHVESLSQWVAKSAMVLAALFLVLMALHVSLDVGLRYLFGKSFTGTLEFVSLLHGRRRLSTACLCGASAGTHQRGCAGGKASAYCPTNALPVRQHPWAPLFRHALLSELSRCRSRYGSNGNCHGQFHLLSMAQSLGVTGWLCSYVPGHPRQHD